MGTATGSRNSGPWCLQQSKWPGNVRSIAFQFELPEWDAINKAAQAFDQRVQPTR